MTKLIRNYLLIGVLLVLLLFSALAGAIADRLFVIRPLDYFFPGRSTLGGRTAEITQRVLTEESVVVDVAEMVADSVVTVSIEQERRVVDPFMDPFGFFGGQGQGGRTETIEQDIGSGFVVEGGLVVTNKHVVSQPNAEYTIIDRNNQEHAVTEIFRDPANDLAILQIENNNLPAIELGDSEGLRVGQFVIAIGTALGEFRHTVTTGVISGLGRGIEASGGIGSFVEEIDNVIQTDAAINPGNSGGPLLNSVGQVIGVNTAVSASGENIGFAIPINVVKESVANFEETGRFDRAFLGVSYRNIDRETALLNDVVAGAYVMQVVEESAAEEAGLQAGDIITKLDGVSVVEEGSSLAELINQKRVGDSLEIEYWSEGEMQTVSVTLRAAN